MTNCTKETRRYLSRAMLDRKAICWYGHQASLTRLAQVVGGKAVLKLSIQALAYHGIFPPESK